MKKQGKNLTIFIEDFTGFTGIDQELITALSYEHGGDYQDLCRVTSVIGITNDYYYAFRGNFKDRVTHQIEVTDRSYGTDEFIVQMAGRYLNAIIAIRQIFAVGTSPELIWMTCRLVILLLRVIGKPRLSKESKLRCILLTVTRC